MGIDISDIQHWVEDQMIRGRYMFTKQDVLDLGLPIKEVSVNRSLQRLEAKGAIMSPWQNFYVAVAMEYRLKGVVPPSFYIDKLMAFLRRDYYVSHLSAAALNGASHQMAMVFQTTVNGGPIRSGVKNGTKLEFTLRQDLPLEFTHKVKTQSGYMTVADAELTALDVVAESKKVGGLSRAAELLVELCEQTKWDESKLPLLSYFSVATIQRLGFILDLIEVHEQADSLYSLMKQTGKTVRKVPLKRTTPMTDDMPMDERWKVVENYELEIDEI
ncbi:MAG: type IV toxin-antitoxin system AbiEi family antitoxin [Prevotella sp.]